MVTRVAAAAVVAFNYNTTALTMSRAAQLRTQLGDDFNRMIAFAIQWAGLRPLQVRDSETSLLAERASFDARKSGLLQAFVDRSLPSTLPDPREVNAATRAALDEIHEKRFPGTTARSWRLRKAGGRSRSRETLYPDRLGLDPYAMRAAFGWLDIPAARSPEERRAWLVLIKGFLSIVLHTVPVVEPRSRQEIDGLPTDFDSWVFKLLARTVPRLTAAERPEDLWHPLLARGAPAHQWVERFYWEWFTEGFAASPSPTEFVRIWRSMIVYALDHATWDPATAVSYELDGAVLELLCFDIRWNAIVRTDENAAIVASLEDVFERALQRWGIMPKVINGFVAFAVQPGASGLLLPSLRWVSSAVKTFNAYDWKYGLEKNVIEFLHTCWQRESDRIIRDLTLREPFLALLSILAARGSHAAIALNTRVSGSLGG